MHFLAFLAGRSLLHLYFIENLEIGFWVYDIIFKKHMERMS